MGQLCVKLPPFSPDYSGVCSALFDLNCIAVLHDASGCTGNYTGFDEPRWYGSRSATFCSGLREIDAVLGDDEKLIQKVLTAAESLKPDLIALVGSPVPMVIGTDMKGIAADLEVRTGIPCFGFDTTGTQYYSSGIAQACISLIKRFTELPKMKKRNGVNLLGVTPLDYSKSSGDDLKKILASHDLDLVACFCEGLTLESVARAGEASLNLVVSKAGIEPARYMQKEFGIPFLAGVPMGTRALQEWLNAIERCITTQQSEILSAEGENADVLILGDEIVCKAMQVGLKTEFGVTADSGCLFGTDDSFTGNNTLNLDSEKKIGQAINSGKYRAVIADPMFRLLKDPQSFVDFLDFPVYSVSSKTAGQKSYSCIGEHFNRHFYALARFRKCCS